MAKIPQPTWEKMSADEIRQAQRHLGTETVKDRHINFTCQRSGRKMFGLIRFTDGYYYLQTKKIDLVQEAMKEEGFRPQINKDGVGTAWGLPARDQLTQRKEPGLTLVDEQQENRPRASQPIRRGAKTFYVSTAAA